MFGRQPLFYPILMCSTFYSLQTPALRCRSNAVVRSSWPPVVIRHRTYSLALKSPVGPLCTPGKTRRRRDISVFSAASCEKINHQNFAINRVLSSW